MQEVLSSHKFTGQTAHVQFDTQANGTDHDFNITGDSTSASLRTTVPVLNNADGTTVAITLALNFSTTGQVVNDTSSHQKFKFGDFTFVTTFKEFTTLADVRGTASWTAGGVATTVTAPLTNGDTFATLDSTLAVDRLTSK